METITIQKKQYQNLLNEIDNLKSQTHFLESQYIKSNKFKKNYCALMSEKSLGKKWLSKEDDLAFKDLENEDFLNSILIK